MVHKNQQFRTILRLENKNTLPLFSLNVSISIDIPSLTLPLIIISLSNANKGNINNAIDKNNLIQYRIITLLILLVYIINKQEPLKKKMHT